MPISLTNELLADAIKARGTVAEREVEQALEYARLEGVPLYQILISTGILERDDFLRIVAEVNCLDFIEISEVNSLSLSTQFAFSVDASFLVKRDWLPVNLVDVEPASDASSSLILTCQPLDTEAATFLEYHKINPGILVCTEATLRAVKARGSEVYDEDGSPVIYDSSTLADMASDEPVINFTNYIFSTALRNGASDLHLEPLLVQYCARMRVDGVLRRFENIPPRLALAVVSRIKILSGLDIAEKRLPQDGKMSLTINGEQLDARVSVLPSAKGEGVVIRFLIRSNVSYDLNKLGISAKIEEKIRDDLKRTAGVILLTGPTGSGKTTTLYSFLNLLNDQKRKLITLEDPVEYQLEGIHQVQVRSKLGLGFAEGLRSILRQDPDIVMVGEIRDRETAEIALQASLTGHLVFSTLHTNDAMSSVERLLDLGVEPFLIKSALISVIAQRLVRKLCDECKACVELGDLSQQQQEFLVRYSPLGLQGKKIFRSVGCSHCAGSGYSGRISVMEYLRFDTELKDLISSDGIARLLDADSQEDLHFLKLDGVEKVLTGMTSVDELLRVMS